MIMINIDLIRNVRLFKECQQHTLKKLYSHLQERIFLPNELAVLCGDVGNEMFIVQRGEFKVFTKDGDWVKTLGADSTFGERAMTSKKPRRSMTIKALP